MNTLKKYEKFKTQLNSFMPDVDKSDLKKCLNKIKHFKNSKRKISLNVQELKLFRFLVMNNYKVETVYGWMLLAECPSKLREEYEQGNISYKEALNQNKADSLDPCSSQMLIDEINWSYECFFAEGGV